MNPIINAPKSKPVLPSSAQTRNGPGLENLHLYSLTLAGDQKVYFHSPPSTGTSCIKKVKSTGFTVEIQITTDEKKFANADI